jgi:N-acetylgalactosamine-N,N'-diacetylbacillosaminyl-diphospho-undecaprenol 4-alpha-N-acetylgalactosaminyltransferase
MLFHLMSNIKKILIVSPSLGNGGAERVSAYLSLMLNQMGYDITILTSKNIVDYPYAGNHISLGLGKNSSNLLRKIISFFKWIHLARTHDFAAVIDTRARRHALRELMVEIFIYAKKTKKIYMCHRSDLEIYIPRPRLFFLSFYKKVDFLISVSKAIEKQIKNLGLLNVKTIYNAIDFDVICGLSNADFETEKPFILGVGRLDENVKQFDHLIRAFVNSGLPEKGIDLRILGQGYLLDSLKELADEISRVKNCIRFEGFVSNPFVYFKNANFLVKSSRLEGFPMVLIEALACGTPVISYDCPTGPSEIIQHEKNGLLVENGSIVALTEAISRMHEDKILYKTCKENARKSVEYLSFDNIKSEWKNLID